MSKPDQAPGEGRVSQKARTRSALLASAARLIREGRRPTVEEAALAAGISKRTAYRYFDSQDHMLADAALDALRERMDATFEAVGEAADAHARLAALAVAMARLAEAHEPELRVMMRAGLDRGLAAQGAIREPARGGRRLEWIETALAPARDRLTPERYARLLKALAVSLGVDALIVLRDVCAASGAEAEAVMTWMAHALLDRALSES